MPPPPLLFAHVPVLLAEVVAALAPALRAAPARLGVDCTVGGGGHAAALLAASPSSELLCLDVDGAAVAAARAALAARGLGARARVQRCSYASLRAALAGEARAAGGLAAVLVDLGASSHQLDPAAGRGFSLRDGASLDMRFAGAGAGGGAAAPTAADLVNGLAEGELALLLRELGEERHAAAAARAIVAARPLRSAAALAAAAGGAVAAAAARAAAARGGGAAAAAAADRHHAATRTLQALRIAVNGELAALQRLLAEAPPLLAPGGVFAAISFHSLEDRLVKRAFRALVDGGAHAHAAAPGGRAFVRAGERELAENPRARSATLRAVVRLR